MANVGKILILGPGPVIVGRSTEYDFACVQALKAFKEEGVETILVNSSPSSVMTEPDLADIVYIEPLESERIKKIIRKERPSAIIPVFGGDMALDITLSLMRSGFLDDNGVCVLGTDAKMIHSVKDRQAFADVLAEIGEPGVKSAVVTNAEAAADFAEDIGYPVMVSPAYTLGGHDKKVCYNRSQLLELAEEALDISLIHQILVEKCISGWKEIEYVVMRDCAGNTMSVCSMENVDPVGINAGDSIIVSPAQTLSDQEAVSLRASAANLAGHLRVTGVCNVRFALRPDGGEYAVLEADPCFRRASALASKVTGYPVPCVTAHLILGRSLDQVKTGFTDFSTAFSEPAVDYCAVKMPKWSFGKFKSGADKLGTAMKATGEAMAIGTDFESAFMKALRSVDASLLVPAVPKFKAMENEELIEAIKASDDERIFAVLEALSRDIPMAAIHEITMIDEWFLVKMKNIASIARALANHPSPEEIEAARMAGYTRRGIEELTGSPCEIPSNSFKTVDTCAAEFDTDSHYYYSTADEQNEAEESDCVLVIGAGAVTVGSGAELDCCTAECIHSLRRSGLKTAVVNNNSGAVSTDPRGSDLLFVSPVTPDDISDIITAVRPKKAIVQFGGKNGYSVCETLRRGGVKILGADDAVFAKTKDLERFYAYLDTLDIPHAPVVWVKSAQEAEDAAREIGYPVFIQGGGDSVLAYRSEEIRENFDLLLERSGEEVLPVRGYYIGSGLDMDVLCDGTDCLVPGITEQIERAGIHSGDSISVYPAVALSDTIRLQAYELARKLALALGVKGMINVRFVCYDSKLYLTRASVNNWRNVPFITRVTGLPVVDIAVQCMLGKKLANMNYGTGIFGGAGLYGVRVPVFSFDRVEGLDTQLGLEMKSTGEALGIADNFEDALLKGLAASGMRIRHSGGVFISVRDNDKQEAVRLADAFAQLGFDIYATAGTARMLNSNFVPASAVRKIHEGSPNTLDLLSGNKIVYVISTSAKGRSSLIDDVKIRRRAVERQIPTFTSLDTANALVRCLKQNRVLNDTDVIDLHTIKNN